MEKYVVRCDPTYWIYYIVELKNLMNLKLHCKHYQYFDRFRLCNQPCHKNISYSLLIRINVTLRNSINALLIFVLIFLEFNTNIKPFNGGNNTRFGFSALTPFSMGF